MGQPCVKDGVEEVILSSWEEFETLTRERFVDRQALIYRGQADYEWPIRSTLDRLEERYSTKQNVDFDIPSHFDCPPVPRDVHLRAFQQAVRCRRGQGPSRLSDDQEWWALAQHHGLATPMLDWTMSPFVALYFAFEEENVILNDGSWGEPEHRVVLVVSSSCINKKDGPDRRAPEPFAPMEGTSPRLTSQNGLFLQMPDGEELEEYVTSAFAGESTSGAVPPRSILTKIQIPNKGRGDCLKLLNKMNINRMTLFPDLDGAGRYINDLWGLGFDTSLGYF
ncbi:FRG domain-containing protein [bacterium]|nr:FRG domain-containing protein [bacterium]